LAKEKEKGEREREKLIKLLQQFFDMSSSGQAAESNFLVFISFCYSVFAVTGLAPQFPSVR
jgi:hypothetical protein